METKAHIRINYLDWLRVLGVLFVFLYHTTRLYNFEDWVVKNNVWYPNVEYWNSFATSFMMPLMFVVSGASLFYALGKGGFGMFLKDKTMRLLVPLLVADLTHISIQAYLWNRTHGLFSGNYFQFLPQYYHLDSINWMGAHLWYLVYLFAYSIILYPLMRWLKGSGSGFLFRLDGWLSKTGVVYILALPMLLLVAFLPDGAPLMDENGGWPYLMYFFFLFYGFLIVSDERLQDKIRQMRWISLSIVLVLAFGHCILDNQLVKTDAITAGMVLLGVSRYFGGWMCVLAFFGLSMQYLTMRTPRLAYANEAVLPFYILHQTVILAVGFVVLQWSIPDLLEWVVVVVLSFAFIMAIYEYLIRRWNVMRFLFGMKRLPPRPSMEATAPQFGGASRPG